MLTKKDLEELLALTERLRRERLPYRTGYRRLRTLMLIQRTEWLVRAFYALDRVYRCFGGACVR